MVTTRTGVIIVPRGVELELKLEERLHPAERGEVGAADVGRRFVACRRRRHRGRSRRRPAASAAGEERQ